jgi:hypothetical protein
MFYHTRACTINIFGQKLLLYYNKLKLVLATVSHFHPSLIFAGKAEAYPNGAAYRTPQC